MRFSLPALPYAEDALAPVISARTIGLHYGKHHRTYVDNLNRLVAGSDLEGKKLEEIVRATAGDPARTEIFNNAGQVWNHNLYWRSLRPGGGGAPKGELADRLAAAFGDYKAFKQQFGKAAQSQFGSGWVWLVADDDGLKIVKTANAAAPVAPAQTTLFTVDVWEHAYYVDYENRRAEYVDAVLDRLINWGFAAENFASRKKASAGVARV
jgi:Fe-Mn family superoxide dismutase